MNTKSCNKSILCLVFVLVIGTLLNSSQGQEQPALDQLVERYQHEENFGPQLEIAKEIISLQDSRVLPELEPHLLQEDRHLRGNAALIFAALGDEIGLKVIEDILNDRSYRPEGQGMGLGASDGKYHAELQIDADRFYAAHLLGVLRDSRAVPILIDVLEDPVVNYKALWALGQIGDTRALGPMVSMLEDKDPSIRVHAISALAQLQDKDALPSLRELVNDNERSHFGDLVTVAEAAKAAISQLEATP